MTIENIEQIDFISTDEKNATVRLTISDHLQWDDQSEKLFTLQSKLNAYLEFICSGQIIKEYPGAVDKKVLISLFCKYDPNEEGLKFLSLVAEAVVEYNATFEWSVSNEN